MSALPGAISTALRYAFSAWDYGTPQDLQFKIDDREFRAIVKSGHARYECAGAIIWRTWRRSKVEPDVDDQ